jgi:hypothetical protein
MIVTGLLKLFAKADQPSSGRRGFGGLYQEIMRPLAALECCLAASLLVPVTLPAAALASTMLFTAYIAVVTWNATSAVPAYCRCFGDAIPPSRISWHLLPRLSAAFLASMFLWMMTWDGLCNYACTPGYDDNLLPVTLTTAVVSACAISLRLAHIARIAPYQKQKRLPEGPGGPAVGAMVPNSLLRTADGQETHMLALAASRPHLVIAFLHSGCRPCEQILATLQSIHVSSVLVISGEFEPPEARSLRPGGIIPDPDHTLRKAYGIIYQPCCLRVGPDGRSLGPLEFDPAVITDLIQNGAPASTTTQ